MKHRGKNSKLKYELQRIDMLLLYSIAFADMIGRIKGSCSKRLREKGILGFAWQNGYGAVLFSPFGRQRNVQTPSVGHPRMKDKRLNCGLRF